MGWDALEAEVLQEFSQDRRTGSKHKAVVDFDDRFIGVIQDKRVAYTVKTKHGSERLAGWGKCEECGESFKYPKKGGVKRFCTKNCLHRNHRRRHGVGLRLTLKCLWCGFSITNRHPNAQFCSPKCRKIFRRKMKNRTRPIRMPKECPHCRTVFSPKTNAYATYCSDRCCKLAYAKRRKINEKKKWGAPRKCRTCGNEFVPMNRLTVSCSRSCSRKFLRNPHTVRCRDHNLYGCKVCPSNSGSVSHGQSSSSPS